MNSSDNIVEGRCPYCDSQIDPLRAGAVSILEGRIVHFCSPACRESYLKRSTSHLEPPSVDGSVYDGTHETEVDIGQEKNGVFDNFSENKISYPAPERGGRFSISGDFRMSLPLLVEILSILLASVFVALVPLEWLQGLLIPAIAGAVCIGELVAGIVGQRMNGPMRLLESTAVPLAATLLVISGTMGSLSRLGSLLALGILFSDRLGRVVEIAGRRRSGVIDVVAGRANTLLAPEWRDNSRVTAWVRRAAIALEWARFPVAALTGGLFWLLGETGQASIISSAITLLALNPRVLRMTTGDAYLTAALTAAKQGIVVRDAHAIQRVGISRIVLLMTKRTLVLGDVRLIGWKVVEGVDEIAVAKAVGALQNKVEGRFAEEIRRFMKGIGRVIPEAENVEIHPGVGVCGNVEMGRVLCGSRVLMIEHGIATGQYENFAATMERSGRRAFFVAVNGVVSAMFGMEEEPVSVAQDVLRQLSRIGLEPAMVTSAEVEPAQALGARLGIENVIFNTREKDLERVLTNMAESGEKVLLVGNGPVFEQCLQSAESAIRIGSDKPSMSGVDAKNQSLDKIVGLITSARNARFNIKANVIFAVLVEMVGIGMALSWKSLVCVSISAALCAASSAFSTVNGPYLMINQAIRFIEIQWNKLLKVTGIRSSAKP